VSAAGERAAFYARSGRAGELLTLLHPPYTAWHLSYFALGAALAPHVRAGRLEWGLAAFALAVGVAAHALDELHGRPLGTEIGAGTLRALALLGALGAVAIGVAGVIVVTPWLAPLVLAGALFLPAYNLELLGGRLHNDLFFALGWGAFPAFTGYFVEAERVDAPALLIAAACLTLSLAQRRLSLPARELRRRTRAVCGTRTTLDGRAQELTVPVLLAPLEGALRAMAAAIVLLAVALVAARL
jgi:hypothetical protein